MVTTARAAAGSVKNKESRGSVQTDARGRAASCRAEERKPCTSRCASSRQQRVLSLSHTRVASQKRVRTEVLLEPKYFGARMFEHVRYRQPGAGRCCCPTLQSCARVQADTDKPSGGDLRLEHVLHRGHARAEGRGVCLHASLSIRGSSAVTQPARRSIGVTTRSLLRIPQRSQDIERGVIEYETGFASFMVTYTWVPRSACLLPAALEAPA